jgi:4-alpha-glucanotransferase
MRFPRSSGVLLHPTSLPGRFGMGDLGKEAYRFADFLAASRQHIWQVLPLTPTGYGNSPYQSPSAFAGNPLLISLDSLVDEGLLEPGDLREIPDSDPGEAAFEEAAEYKLPLLREAYERFHTRGQTSDFLEWTSREEGWLEDYSLYFAVKQAHGDRPWTEWESGIAARDPAAMTKWQAKLADEIEACKFEQFIFFRQWNRLKTYCRDRGIRMFGDLPIYVAHDSADVWSHPELFCLDAQGQPASVAGVPPDYFSATGQLWGNPIYNWSKMSADGFKWWIERIHQTLGVVDMIRLDHFRGIEAYWEVPAGETTAVNGKWVKGPGASLLAAAERALGELPIVAENLGVITPEVEEIRGQFSFPGMAVLQFAFGNDAQAPSFRPHNYDRNLVAYTGTHDNDTTVGWWRSSGSLNSTRTEEDVRKEGEVARAYLDLDGPEKNISWALVRALMASVADTVVIPLQDILSLDSSARMNVPGTVGGSNWRWRFREGMVTPEITHKLAELTTLYDR